MLGATVVIDEICDECLLVYRSNKRVGSPRQCSTEAVEDVHTQITQGHRYLAASVGMGSWLEIGDRRTEREETHLFDSFCI